LWLLALALCSVPSTSTPSRPLALATISFAVCFAAWGLISASVP
jgi:nitrate/nitrite transporter NarK